MSLRAAAGVLAALCAAAALSCGPRAGGDVVTFWAFGVEGEHVAKLIPAFERANPGIHVHVQMIPWNAAHEKLLTAFAGQSLPDVWQLGNTWIPEFTTLNALEDLGPWLARSRTLRQSCYFPGIWDTNVMDSVLYGIPWYVDTRVLFYRSDLFARAGVARPPRSWEEWRDDMRRVKALPGGEHYAILLPTDEWAQPVILALQAGAGLLREGGRYADFKEPNFRRAFSFYVSLFAERLAPPLGNAQVANLYQQFADGYFASDITGPWNLEKFRLRLPPERQGDWATAPLAAERAEDYPGVSLAGGSSLVVLRPSRCKDAAFRLIEFLAARERQLAFYRLTGDLPTRVDVWDDPVFTGDPHMQAFLLQLRRITPMPRVPEWERTAWAIAESAERVILGQQTEEQSLDQLQTEVDRMLEKRRFLLDRETRGKAR